MKHKKILFVCTGNTCRSPMAEAAMRQELKKRKIKWYTVQSAGMRAAVGSAMSVNSAIALSERHIPYQETFTARQITPKMVEEAYAVVCMTESQRLALGAPPNVTSFYELCGEDIPDPYGQGVEAYRNTLRAIEAHLPRLIERLMLEETNRLEKGEK